MRFSDQSSSVDARRQCRSRLLIIAERFGGSSTALSAGADYRGSGRVAGATFAALLARTSTWTAWPGREIFVPRRAEPPGAARRPIGFTSACIARRSRLSRRPIVWSFGETVRPGSTSMFAGVHLINGYSPISPAGVGRLFDFGTHGQINPAKVREMVIPESGPDGLLAISASTASSSRGTSSTSRAAGEWEIVQQWTDGYVYHRRERLEHVRARVAEGFASAAVKIVENSRHRVIADVTPADATRPVTVLFSRPFFPGYQARLDGAVLPVSAVRGLIPSVEIPAGRSDGSSSAIGRWRSSSAVPSRSPARAALIAGAQALRRRQS